MTAINNIEDLIRLLDENPEWLEAVRARILTRELLDLPQTLAKFIEATNQRFDELDQRLGAVESETKSIRVDMEEGFASVRREMGEGFQSVQKDIESIRNDMGILKGAHARNSVIRQATAITDEMDLNRVRNLDYDDLREMTLAADVSGIARNELMSFRLADLVMEATDQSGETCYVAVEISFTANGRDTRRALRNADYLARFTGCPAHAVVAGIDRDNRISEAIEAGTIYWHQLNLDDLETD